MDLDSGSDLEAQAFLQTPDGAELASLFPKVSRGRLRRKLLDLVRAIAENENESGGEAPRRVSCEA
jgi:hypothetical protein